MTEPSLAIRWSARRKAALVHDLGAGRTTAEQLLADHAMSPEELDSLVRRYGQGGEAALKQKHLKGRSYV